ncbi:MAG: FAD-dependent oxidoreductase [Rhodoglobus sp.]
MAEVIVVGGGLAGLVMARDLAEAGVTVTLLEASDHLGGTVARHDVGGISLDAGAESFATRGGHVERLASILGLGNEVVRPNPVGAWILQADGTAHPIPKNTLLGIPGIPAARDVTEILGARAAFRASLDALMPDFVGARSRTLGELVRTRMGAAVVERLVAPIAGGVHSTHPDELDLDRVAPGLRSALRHTGALARAVRDLTSGAAAGSNVVGIRGGVVRIVDELVADLERFGVDVRLGARATAVAPGEVRVGGETLAGRVVVAASGLLGEAARGTDVTLVTLVVDEPRLDAAPRGTGVLVAPGAVGIRSKALTHATAKWPWLAERANGKHVLRLSYAAIEGDVKGVAIADASAMLGMTITAQSVVDTDSVTWTRPAPSVHAAEGIIVTGEAAAGTGLAAVVADAREQAGSLLQELR